MVNYELPEELHGFWDTEAYSVPLFEEVLRFAAMCEASRYYTEIACLEADFAISGEISFAKSKLATAYARQGWRERVLAYLIGWSLADWEKSRLIYVRTK